MKHSLFFYLVLHMERTHSDAIMQVEYKITKKIKVPPLSSSNHTCWPPDFELLSIISSDYFLRPH